MLAADNWCIKVDEQVYGPYSSSQLRKFAHEGRLAASSLLAPAGSQTWRLAKDESTFATFFGLEAKGKIKKPKFGRLNITKASEKPATDAVPDVQESNFIVIFDVVSGAAGRVAAAVMGLGNAFQIADNVWTVSCELTAVGVRNAIAPYLNPRESIFVVDATRGHSSWQNYSPATKAKLTQAWAEKRA